MVKLFQFPSFEDWNNHEREFKETIGEFTCVFHRTSWKIDSFDTRYECAIACSENPTNIYVHSVVSWSFECDSRNTGLVKKKYIETIREIHARWVNYLENTYHVSNGSFCPEYISLKSIIIAAFCASNKKELSLGEINQILNKIDEIVYSNDTIRLFVDVPINADAGYLEQIVNHGYKYFRLSRDYTGIKLISDANPTQMYFNWEIKNSTILDVIKNFYNPNPHSFSFG